METNLVLERMVMTPKTSVGVLFWLGADLLPSALECFVLEDFMRPEGAPKVPGETAIPLGRYEIIIDESPKFKRRLPRLFNKTTSDGRRLVISADGKTIFEGVLIHPGNDADDTLGCLLPGRVHATPDRVLESKAAFDALFSKLEALLAVPGNRVFITVRARLFS